MVGTMVLQYKRVEDIQIAVSIAIFL